MSADDKNAPEHVEDAPRDASRRSLLKGTVTAAPALLTLHSGAALARSSNLISASPAGTTDSHGRTLCLDLDSVHSAGGSGTSVDLGEPAFGKVAAINDRRYHVAPRRRSQRVSESEMCHNGGTYYYRNRWSGGRWRTVKVKQGVIVSATALSSFAGNIHVYDL